MNGTDDTEYEDDDDDDAYIDEDTPEPETGGEGDDDDEVYVPRRQSPELASIPVYRGYRPPSRNLPQSHEFVFRRDRPIRGATIPPAVNTTQLPPSANIQGATSRLNAQILAAYASPAPPSPRPRGHGQGLRSMADMLPIIESSVSPPPSDVASNRSESTDQSNRAVFRDFQGGSASRLPRDNGALTLDLDSTEAEHDHRPSGVPPPTLPRHLRSGHDTPDSFINLDRRPVTATSPSQSQSEIINSQPPVTIPQNMQHQNTLQLQPPVVWPYREPNDPSPLNSSTRDLLEPVQPASGTDGRGRSVKRSLRNTLNVAEHYASSFLFGRSATAADDI